MVWVCTCALVHMWRSEDNFVELLLSFCPYVRMGIELRLSGLLSKCFLPFEPGCWPKLSCFFSFSIFFSCGVWCACVCMRVFTCVGAYVCWCTWRPRVDVGNHPKWLFYFVHWGRVSHSNPEPACVASLASQPTLGMSHLLGLELQVSHHYHLALMCGVAFQGSKLCSLHL